MAGSAINLGISQGMLTPGLGQNQQALLDQLGQRAKMLGRPTVNLEDPASLRAEAQRLQQAGDQAGAMRMLQTARALEDRARQETLRRRQEHATLDAGMAEINKGVADARAKQRQRQEDSRQYSATIQRLRDMGLDEEAEMVRTRAMSPKEGVEAIRSELRQQRSDKRTTNRAKAAASTETEAETAARQAQADQLNDIASRLTGPSQTMVQELAVGVQNGASFTSALSAALKEMDPDDPAKLPVGEIPSKTEANEIYKQANKLEDVDIDSDKKLLFSTAVKNEKKQNPAKDLETIMREVAADMAEADAGNPQGFFKRIFGGASSAPVQNNDLDSVIARNRSGA